MIVDSKRLVEETTHKNQNLESECMRLKEEIERIMSQTNEMKGLMEMYKEKYKTEKYSNRQAPDNNRYNII